MSYLQIAKLTTFQNMEFSKEFMEWVQKRSSTFKNGISIMGSNLKYFQKLDQPFFLIFDEFHLKDLSVCYTNFKE